MYFFFSPSGFATVQRDVGPGAADQAEAVSSPGVRQVQLVPMFAGSFSEMSLVLQNIEHKKEKYNYNESVFWQGGGSETISVQIKFSSDSGQDGAFWNQGKQCGWFWGTGPAVFPPRTRLLPP